MAVASGTAVGARRPKMSSSVTKAREGRRWRDLILRRSRFTSLYLVEALERVELVKAGVPASLLVRLSEDMAIPRNRLYAMLGLARATVDRKVSGGKVLNQDESERVLGIARLLGQVETIVKESGQPESFDPAKWTAAWLERPHPALGGRRPAELMDTADGRGIVSDLVARMQSGAYT